MYASTSPLANLKTALPLNQHSPRCARKRSHELRVCFARVLRSQIYDPVTLIIYRFTI